MPRQQIPYVCCNSSTDTVRCEREAAQDFVALGERGFVRMREYARWQLVLRGFVRVLARCFYRFRLYGLEHLPADGPALLVCNHISWLDGILVLLLIRRPVRMVAWAGNFQAPWLRAWAKRWGVIFIDPRRRKEMVAALKVAQEALENGELVWVFPEGGISRTGQLQGFKRGVMWILDDLEIPVIPAYLDELWGSIFSFAGGRFFWKLPRKWPYPISLHVGEPIHRPRHLHQIRTAVAELGAIAAMRRADRFQPVSRRFIRRCKQRLFGSKVADSLGADLSGGELLMRTIVLRRILRRGVLRDDEHHVGVLLPPGAAAVVVNAALTLDRRVAVNLNYTVSSEIMNACIQTAEIRTVLTSRRFMEKMKLELEVDVVYLEDFKDAATLSDKLLAFLQTFVVPSALLARAYGLHHVRPDDLQTIIFTSGSTGIPKGVMLTQYNVASNVEAVEQVIHLRRSDVLVGILPFFHSFGYTITLWTVLGLDVKGIYHFSPLDARQIGQLARTHRATVLLSTPTFLRGFLRRCEPEDFATLDVVVTGAEKLPPKLADAFEDRFGVRPVEGYGTTELSPLVSVNIPPSRQLTNFQVSAKEGSVGRPIPGVAAKTTDLDSGEDLGPNERGMLLIKGPNVMKGYYKREDLTTEVIHDGWYTTGDVAYIDEDGFIFITGRESRFSKIGGEMVPHIVIEEKLAEIIGGDEDVPSVAVTSVPDERKGERLVVLHTPLEVDIDTLRAKLADAGLPNIYIPSADSFYEVDEIPILGSGKLDLRRLKAMALERTGQSS